MYLMYVDESGDVGLKGSPTPYFILCGIIIHESKWREVISKIHDFRKGLKLKYNLLISEEIHAQVFANGRFQTKYNISSSDRIRILLDCLDFMGTLQDLVSVVTVRYHKGATTTGVDVFEIAWKALLQRFENTIIANNFPTPVPKTLFNARFQRGIVLPDNTDGGKLRKIIRKMRHINFIPGRNGLPARNIPIERIIEDEIMRDSKQSNIHQMVDVIAYFAKQYYAPNSKFSALGIDKEYKRILPVINTKASSNSANHFIVQL